MGHLRNAGAALVAVAALSMPASAAADWPVYGHDLANSRSAGRAGPAPSMVPGLKPAWTFSSQHGDFTGTPVVSRGVLVAGTSLGTIYAVDAVTGKLRWSRNVGQPINGSAAIDPRPEGGPTVYVPVAQIGAPRLLALSLRTGKLRWNRVLNREDGADVFGSPVVWHERVYIGTSGPNNDESHARGSVVAIDEETGRVVWRTHTVPKGHDGAAVWSTPAIDPKRGRLYVGTGNAYHDPAAATTDSVLALGLAHGRILAHHQTTPGDVWQLDSQTGGPDHDFGASPNLIRGPGGRLLVGEGNKSGTYWAFDRSRLRPVWKTTVGPGSSVGGILGSTAYDGTGLYGDDTANGQVWSLGRGGLSRWSSSDGGTLNFSPVAVANGVVYSITGATGTLTARAAATGAVLAKIQLGAPAFGGVSVVGRAVYAATGTGPPPQVAPFVPDTSNLTGNGTIVALGDTSMSGAARTFDGGCDLSGSVAFTPPLKSSPQDLTQSASAPGKCSGTFTDAAGRRHDLSNLPVTFSETSFAKQASCASGTATGPGKLSFRYGTIRFKFSEIRGGPVPVATATGLAGGSAHGTATPSPGQDPKSAADCAGAGIKKFQIDIHLETTPNISG